jgi:ribonuclease D
VTTIAHEWVDDQSAFERILTEVSGVDRYAIDTEFHRERTYFPALALVQIAWGDRIVLVDPLSVDVTAMADLFHSEVEAVFHAAQQDLDVLTYAVGAVPDHFFDTQLAGGFLGYGTPSLVSLLSAELGVSPAKGDRLTDWLRRPLTEAQRSYAASDVAHLLEVRDRLVERLKQRGREAWVAEACAELAARNAVRSEPEQAWLRLKDVRSLKPRGRAVAQEVAAWRERRAMALDVPVRQVLPDLAVLGVSQRQPRDERELAQARGVDGRHTKGVVATELLAAVARGLENEPPQPPTGGDELGRDLRPAVALVSAWVSQMARDEAIDTALLATRADLVSLLSGDPASRLASGWRAELLGDGIRSLVEGRAGLTFNGSGGLRLVSVDAVG